MLILLALTIFILSSATAVACEAEPIANLTFGDMEVYFLDHTGNPEEGNWISLGGPAGVSEIRLPSPIKITYDGPKSRGYGGVSATLHKGAEEAYTVSYPYTTHPVYLPDENVTMSFRGEPGLAGDVVIYLFKPSSGSVRGVLDTLLAGENVDCLSDLFHENMDGYYETFPASLDGNGDLLDHDFGPMEAGQYCIVLLQDNGDKSLTVLSATAFMVVEYELEITAESIVKGNNLDISLELPGVPETDDCSYGAVLIRDQAYKANIEIDSDGTRAGTSVIVNEIDVIEEFDINSSNYRSKLSKGELQTELQTMMGEGKGAISLGVEGKNTLSLTAFDLPVGDYVLLAAVYQPGKGLVALGQEELEIKVPGKKKSKGSSSGGGGGGGGGSPEPASNVRKKELAQQFVTNGNRIRFELTQRATSVGYVEFDAKKSVGKTTTIIEELKSRSTLTPTEPEGEVYRYLNIWVGNGGFATPENIEGAVVGFRVSRDWIIENNVDADSIILQHFSESRWNLLPTTRIGEDEEYIYFEAETPGFSPFAITTSGKSIILLEQTGGEEDPLSVGTNTPEQETGLEPETSGKFPAWFSKIASFLVGVMMVVMIGLALKKKEEP